MMRLSDQLPRNTLDERDLTTFGSVYAGDLTVDTATPATNVIPAETRANGEHPALNDMHSGGSLNHIGLEERMAAHPRTAFCVQIELTGQDNRAKALNQHPR